jgi:hypothetical protein
MSAISRDIWVLLFVAAGIGIMVGVPVRLATRPLVRRGALTLALGIIGPIGALALRNLRNNPPRTPHDIGVAIGLLFVTFLLILRITLGKGSVSRIGQHIIASALYDLLKMVAGAIGHLCVLFARGLLRCGRLMLRLARRLLQYLRT